MVVSNISLSSHCGYMKQLVNTAIEKVRVSRDEMHDDILASPSSADNLTKHMTRLNGFRTVENEEIES